MRPPRLTSETEPILTHIHTFGWTLSTLGTSAGASWRLVKANVERRVAATAVAVENVNASRCYAHQLL